MKKSIFISSGSFMMTVLCLVVLIGCNNKAGGQASNSSHNQGSDLDLGSKDPMKLAEVSEVLQEETIARGLKELESEYAEMLQPISSLKMEQPKIYWFIVSWLKTAYKTPDWTGYYSADWMIMTKQKGIDCSGFSRVMLEQIFDHRVSGGSQRLLDHHSTRTGLGSLEMGDLVFFRAPYATNNKVVHVGVYLLDGYFVHATSTKSAAKGLGLSVSSLEEENWAKEFVSGGKVKG